MLKIDDVNECKVLSITASGKLTKAEYDRAIPELERMLNEHGKLRFYIKLEDFSGFEPAAAWEDLKFDVRHRKQFGRIAVVGTKKSQEWGTKLSSFLFDSEVKFFKDEDRARAWDWVNE